MKLQFQIRDLIWLIAGIACLLAVGPKEPFAALEAALGLAACVGVLAGGAIVGERVFAAVERRRNWFCGYVTGLATMLMIWVLAPLVFLVFIPSVVRY